MVVVAYVVRFIRSRNYSTHTLVVALGLFTGFIGSNTQARIAFESLLARHPNQAILYGFLVFAASAYKGSHTLEAQAANVGTAVKQAKKMQVDLSHDS